MAKERIPRKWKKKIKKSRNKWISSCLDYAIVSFKNRENGK